MGWIDWTVLLGTLLFIILYGIWKNRQSSGIEDYIKGDDQVKWWAIGLSVMATQASAITFLSTPGQAYADGLGFVQFYFGLPLAMVVVCLVFIPIYHKQKVYTAYELLEHRFDKKTRTLTAFLFLVQRGLAAGITIYAPSIILSAVLGWKLNYLVLIIGIVVTFYTVIGGADAVNKTQKLQMFVIMSGMFFAFFQILQQLPAGIGFEDSLKLAGLGGKLNIVDFDLNFDSRYTFWSGITGGFFLALSYFGTDQSQVQRYLSGNSVRKSQMGLFFNGVLKVPMQFFILLVGVMVFVFYQFQSAPLHFNPANRALLQSYVPSEFSQLEKRKEELHLTKLDLQKRWLESSQKTDTENLETSINLAEKELESLREQAKELILDTSEDLETNDKDYVFIHFILNELPTGLIGLLLAVILSAAMSSTSSELSALGTTTAIDLYKSYYTNLSDNRMVTVTKLFTLGWGLLAILFASLASLFDNLIQLVNIIGSIFYGNILGVFLLAFFFKPVKGKAVFWAAILTQILILMIYSFTNITYLWLNFIGCALVMLIAFLFQALDKKTPFTS